MNELYWISVISKINTLFWIGVTASAVSILINFILYLDSLGYEEEKCSLSKKRIRSSIIVAIICGLFAAVTPGRNETYFIYGAGTIVDYCKNNSKVKEIPDKAIDALNRYLDNIESCKENE